EVDVRELTKKVAYFITPKKVSKEYLPPAVRFQWGSFHFDGIMDSMEESLEFFSSDGVPLRASVSLSLSQQRIEPFAGKAAGAGGADGGPPGAAGRGGGGRGGPGDATADAGQGGRHTARPDGRRERGCGGGSELAGHRQRQQHRQPALPGAGPVREPQCERIGLIPLSRRERLWLWSITNLNLSTNCCPQRRRRTQSLR